MLDDLYPESVEEAGAFLRLALKEIASYNLAYNPVTYAVWYEFATARNPDLNREINRLKQSDIPISNDMVLKWFRQYIANQQMLVAEQKTRELQAILAAVAQHIGNSGSRLGNQGQALEAYTRKLGLTRSIEEVMDISQGIISETRDMISDSQSLKKEMDDTMTEIQTLKKELEGVKQAAKTDMLTGLLNRRGFEEAMARSMVHSKETGTPLSIIIADIDLFKRINDTHGHLIGDNVLKMLAKLLLEHIKGKDTAARFGGEEFIMILPETHLKGAYILAEQLRIKLKAMRWRTKSGEEIGSISMSMGVAQCRPGEPLDLLIERADNALYEAKARGRNRTVTELDMDAA